MTNITVISRTQKIIVDPPNSSVSVMNAGPMGPAGPTGPQNILGLVQAAIIELSTTDYGATIPGQQFWSTVHQAIMRWTGTQWVFADGLPRYFTIGSDFIIRAISGFDYFDGMDLNWRQLASGGNQLTQAPGRFGVITFNAANSINSGGGFQLTPLASQVSIYGGTVGLWCRIEFCIPAAALISTVTHRMGFHDSVSSSDAVDGNYLEIINATASFKSADNSARTTHGTTATIVADTYYTLHIWYPTTTTARCLLIKSDGTVVLDVTNTSNVPGVTRTFGLSGLSANSVAGGSLDLCRYDKAHAGVVLI